MKVKIIVVSILLLAFICYSQEQVINPSLLENSSDNSATGPAKSNPQPGSSILVGAVFGIIAGCVLGQIILGNSSHDRWRNGIRGAHLGMVVLPFVNYELFLKHYNIPREQNRWGLYIGGQLPLKCGMNMDTHPSLATGLTRSYHASNRLDIL